MSAIPLILDDGQEPFILTGAPTETLNFATGNQMSGLINLKGPAGEPSIRGISSFVSGQPIANEYIVSNIAPYDFDITKKVARSLVAATNEAIFTIRVNDVVIGTIIFAAGASIGTITLSEISVLEDDLVTIQAPAIQDPTLADIAFLLAKDN